MIRLNKRLTKINGIKMNAKEVREAIVEAYLLPTMGLNPIVICLLALVMYALEVVEILARSGIKVF